MNKFKYRDGKKDIEINAEFTNEVGESAATIFAMIRGGQAPPRQLLRNIKTLPGQAEMFEPAEVVDEGPKLGAENTSNRNAYAKVSGGAVALTDLFEERDGEWTFTNPNFKAKSKSDFFRKATCLYLQLQLDKGVKTVGREEIKNFLDNYDAYDGNYRKWLAKEMTLLRVSANGLSIIYPGSQLVAETLAEIADESIPTVWKVGTRKTSGRKQAIKKQSQEEDEHID